MKEGPTNSRLKILGSMSVYLCQSVTEGTSNGNVE